MNLYRVTDRSGRSFYVYHHTTSKAMDSVTNSFICKRVTESIVITPVNIKPA